MKVNRFPTRSFEILENIRIFRSTIAMMIYRVPARARFDE